MSNDHVGNAMAKWGAIGFLVGLVPPYMMGGMFSNFSLLWAIGGAVLFGWIASEGASSQSKDSPEPARDVKDEEVAGKERELIVIGESEVTDQGYLRKDFQYSTDGYVVDVVAAVDYDGIGPLGEEGKQTVNIFYSIDRLSIQGGINMQYESTSRAVEVLNGLHASVLSYLLIPHISKDLEMLVPNEEPKMPDSDIEPRLIKSRAIAIGTSAYDESDKYEKAYWACKDLMRHVLERHKGYIDLVLLDQKEMLSRALKKSTTDGEYEIEVSGFQALNDDLLMALALVAFQGWAVPEFGKIQREITVCATYTDYLLNSRGFRKANLIKGLVHKYGADVYCRPDVEKAKDYLLLAIDAGAISAGREMRHVDMHKQLESLDSKHKTSERRWDEISSYEHILRAGIS